MEGGRRTIKGTKARRALAQETAKGRASGSNTASRLWRGKPEGGRLDERAIGVVIVETGTKVGQVRSSPTSQRFV